jgi:hypothetical protein
VLATVYGHIRRCTFRRLSLAAPPGRAEAADYRAACLYVDRDAPRPLGDLATAKAICAACTFPGIFRPDED